MAADEDVVISSSTMVHGSDDDDRAPFWRQPLGLGAVGAAVAAAVVITVVAVSSEDTAPSQAATLATYDLGSDGSGGVVSSCVPLADVEPVAGAAALAGTVTAIEGSIVVIDVDRWYAGGDADQVRLQGTAEGVALDGLQFVVGERYFLTAVDGMVQPCGVSGAESRELNRLYDRWYG